MATQTGLEPTVIVLTTVLLALVYLGVLLIAGGVACVILAPRLMRGEPRAWKATLWATVALPGVLWTRMISRAAGSAHASITSSAAPTIVSVSIPKCRYRSWMSPDCPKSLTPSEATRTACMAPRNAKVCG